MTTAVSLEALVSLAKRRGFIYQGSEIYGGLAGTYDYGPLGTALKRNITNLWWKLFVEDRNDMYGIDSTVLMNPRVWQASGHVATFSDPLIECANCKVRLRVDQTKADKCPQCAKMGTFGKAKQFNMMFKTTVGPVADESAATYLRPETAQGMFTNFKNVVDSFSPDLPFGLAQIGRSFRNEISPRDFVFRLREFEIMELEYFIHPQDWEKEFVKWQELMHEWWVALDLPQDKIHEKVVPAAERAHYSKRTVDFEFAYPFGKEEFAGLAYRTDFDLAAHEKASGANLRFIPKDGSAPFIPHVIEPTFGLDRHVLAVLANAYTEEKVSDEMRVVLKLPVHLAPIKVAVAPLLKNKPELAKLARQVYEQLKPAFGAVMYDDNGNIGKRYRRQDEIGTPFFITVDFDSLKGRDVTVRDRDSMKQDRIKISALTQDLSAKLAPTST
ncbi:glycine--tRNA ligase [Candidatus Microgenomates bacterium]|nr:glycine--tRNA ligase [Candidatus Microgenomates bacterium]